MRQRFIQVRELAGAGICHGIEMVYYQLLLSRSRMSVGFSVSVPEIVISSRLIIVWCEANLPGAFVLTARQYGEVVLPDAASGQSPGTLARKLSRCKEGMAHFLPSGYKVL